MTVYDRREARAIGGPAAVLGTGRAHPEGILTNADLERLVDTSDAWITARTGIARRHKAADGEYTSQFAVRAARQALERAGVAAGDVDLLVCATVTPDQLLPSTACLIQAELGAHRAAAFDLAAACSGFLYGLTLNASNLSVRHCPCPCARLDVLARGNRSGTVTQVPLGSI